MKIIFLLKGLDCPHCAAQIEKEVGALPQVSTAQINLLQQTLTVEASEDRLLPRIQNIVHSHEPAVEVCLLQREHDRDHHAEHSPHRALRLAVGGLLFATGLFTGGVFSLVLLLFAYALLGWDVVLSAAGNLVKGRVFDENFLMALATLGAFAIGEYHEAVAVMLFYQTGEFFQALAVRRSRCSIAALLDIRPDHAQVLREGKAVTVRAETVAVGESILVRPGERIPLDGTVLDGSSSLDTSALTGESMPRQINPGDQVLSGCINQGSLLTIQITKPFDQSTAAKIIDLVENASSRKAPSENFITTFARWYTPVVVVAAALLATVPPLFLGDWVQWLRRGLVFLVVSCPCALVISIPLTFFGGIGAASRQGILVKGSNFLEALNSVSTVVFDKTGTLTEGVFRVTDIFTADGFTREQVLEYAARAEQYSSHPIARSILVAYGRQPDAMETFQEISGQGVLAAADGEIVLAGNCLLMQEKNIAHTPCQNAGTKVYVAVDGVYAGCILIADSIKADSAMAIRTMKAMGVDRIVMLTGDEDTVAQTVAQSLGIDEYHAGLLPEDKVAKLEQLEAQLHPKTKLAFVGDGINDAPVLARADIGVAMGALGADAAIEAADVVLMTDEPGKLPEAIAIAKATKKIVTQNIVLALGLKGIILGLGLLGIAGMWAAVFADVGVAMLAVLNAMRMLLRICVPGVGR